MHGHVKDPCGMNRVCAVPKIPKKRKISSSVAVVTLRARENKKSALELNSEGVLQHVNLFGIQPQASIFLFSLVGQGGMIKSCFVAYIDLTLYLMQWVSNFRKHLTDK